MIRLSPSLLGFILLLMQPTVAADEAELMIQPESCMVKDGWCEVELQVSWNVSPSSDVCIQVESQPQMQCFETGVSEQIIAIKTNRPLRIQLLDKKSKKLLSSALLNVFVREYRKRRRQRHAWSVIQ